MARTDLIVDLVNAATRGDTQRARKTAERMISEARANNRRGVADQLADAMAPNELPLASPVAPRVTSAPPARGADPSHMPAVAERTARRPLRSVRMKSTASGLVASLLKEQSRAGELRAHGLEPRHKLLLVGPPGNGKTSLAEAIAAELGRPFLVVRYDGLIASYLGETAARLKRVFEIARAMPCVLFFDEVEAIAKERGDAQETGEIKRVLTSLMMQIDELPSTCLLVAATNHPDMLDSALWRRFQVRIDLPEPDQKELKAFVKEALKPVGKLPAKGVEIVLEALGRASYSDAEELVLSIRRRIVLDGPEMKLPAIFAAARDEWVLRGETRPSHEPASPPTACDPDR